MIAKGFATVMAGSLACSIDGADWHFSIRRVDDKTHGPFFDFHQKDVRPSDVATFVPNWESLTWSPLKDSMLGKSESVAKDTEFRINVLSNGSGGKTHEEVVQQFLAFMKSSSAT